MSNVISPMPPAGAGIIPNSHTFKVRNVSGSTMTAGQVAMIDLALADGDTTSVIPGHNDTSGNPDNVFACVVLPSTLAHTRTAQMVVILETIVDGAIGNAAATMVGTAAVRLGQDYAKGAALVCESRSGWLVNAPGYSSFSATSSQDGFLRGEKIVAFLNQTASVGSGGTASTSVSSGVNVWFCGFGAGFGQNAF